MAAKSSGGGEKRGSLPGRPDYDQKKQQQSQSSKADEEDKWTFYSSSQNLVSVLHDPTVPRSYNDTIFTKDWGSYFVDTATLPCNTTVADVDKSFFENYVRQRRRREKYLKKFAMMAKAKATRRRQADDHSHDLDGIPKIFLESDFNLDNRETFNSAFSFSDSDTESTKGFNNESLRLLQKNLSDYLDVVEESLSSQISHRFRDFFQIMSAIDMVMDQISKTIREVTLVRNRCDLLRNALVKPTIKNIQLHQLRKNAENCYNTIELMAKVYHNHSLFHGQLSSKDYVSALNLIAVSKKNLSGSLVGVNCFKHLESEIDEREKLIGALMQQDYSKFLTAEWLRPVSSASQDCPISEEDTLATIICGLLRLDNFNFMEKFKEEACAAITSTTKQTLIETLSDHDDIDVSDRREDALMEKTRQLDYGTWLELNKRLFDKIFNLLKRIEVVHSVIMGAIVKYSATLLRENEKIKEMRTSKATALAPYTNGSSTAANGSAQSVISAICDFAHDRCASLVERKVNDGSLDRLLPSEFTEFSSTVEMFVVRCSKISGQRSPSLKHALQVQANKFATRFHDEKRKRLVHLMEIEQWKSVDGVSPDFQALVTKICEKNDFSGSGSSDIKKSNRTSATNEVIKGMSHLTVKGERFVIVNTTQTLVSIITEYCQTADELKPLAADILTRLLELLKYFGQKTISLVHKGEAINIAGLKCITVRNLANSARALQLIIALTPAFRSHFESVLPSKQQSMAKHFDEIVKQYQSCCDKVYEKMLAIAREQITLNLSKWEAKPPVPSPQFQSVIQYLGLLQGNLEDCLPIHELVDFMKATHEAFKEVVRSHLQRLKIINDGGPLHGLVTQELIFYCQSLNKRLVGKHTKFTIDDLWPR